jgi:hypothetical protein
MCSEHIDKHIAANHLLWVYLRDILVTIYILKYLSVATALQLCSMYKHVQCICLIDVVHHHEELHM